MNKKLIAIVLAMFMSLSGFIEALAISEQTLRIKDMMEIQSQML